MMVAVRNSAHGILLCGFLVCGCEFPSNPNVNVAHDPDDPETFNSFQSEQSLVRSELPGGERLLVMAFHDSTGQTTTGSDGRPAFVPNYTLMGLAISADDGSSWLRQPQFATPTGLTALRGDPWLATNGPDVWYVMLASTRPPDPVSGDASPNTIAYTHSSTAGTFWDPIHWIELPYTIDKCSAALSDDGQDVYVAYVNQSSRHIELLVTNNAGMSWHAPRPIPPTVPEETHQNPIVRTVPGLSGTTYVSFQVARQGFQHVDVARSTNRGQVYSVMSQVDPSGILPAPFLDAAGGRRLRNLVYQHFAVQPGTRRLFVAYEDRSTVYVQSSPDGSPMSWTSPTIIRDPLGDRQFQVTIAASESLVGALFYQQPPSLASDRAQTVVIGANSSDGLSWGSTVVSSTPPTGEVPFEPCPTGIGGSAGYFGDYVGLAPLALPGDQSPNFLFFGAWADSRDGCITTDRFMAIHHHTVGTRGSARQGGVARTASS